MQFDCSEQPIYELPQSNDLLENDIGLRHPESAYQQVIGLSEISVCCTKNNTPNFSQQPSSEGGEIENFINKFSVWRSKHVVGCGIQILFVHVKCSMCGLK